MSTITVDNNTIRVEEVDGQKYYCAKDLCQTLGIKNCGSATTYISSIDKTYISFCIESKTRKCRKIPQKLLFLSTNGAKELLLRTRSPHAHKLSNLLNIKMDTKYECKEGATVKQVLQVFSGEIMKTQQSCGPYRIDLFPRVLFGCRVR